MLWKFCDYLCSMMWSYWHDPALSLPHSVKKTLHLGSKLTSICKFIHFFLSKDSAPLSCPQLRSRFAFSYVLQQDTYLGRKQCYLWWIFFPICGLLCWVCRAVISSREDSRRVWGKGGKKGGVSCDTKKRTRWRTQHCWVLCLEPYVCVRNAQAEKRTGSSGASSWPSKGPLGCLYNGKLLL